MTELTTETLRAELAPLKARLDGFPLIARSISELCQEMRNLRAVVEEAKASNIAPDQKD